MLHQRFAGVLTSFWKTGARLALAGIIGWSAVAIAQDEQSQAAQQSKQAQQAAGKQSVPDAQVESNVLKALAAASDLANQPITTTTVYGVVTLSGTVQTEAQRTEAENIVARTAGVQKVVDEMTLAGEAGVQSAQNDQSTNPNLQSDGTMAPAPAGPSDQWQSPNQAAGPSYGPGAPEYHQPYSGPPAPLPPGYPQQPQYPQQQFPQQPQYSQQYPQQPPYGQSYPYPQQPYPQQRYPQQPYSQQPAYRGQVAGQMVTIPSGMMVRVRINQSLDSSHNNPGDRFDGVVVSDVVADGAVAIPRGATVEGTVVDARSSGALAGRGELSLQLTGVMLAGKTYPLQSDVWAHNSGDKAVSTVGGTAVGTGLGAIVGGAAGGGQGAAIGAGVGAMLGLGASAASGSGHVYVPAEGLLTFHIAQPVTVATVSQAEMDRLAQGVGRIPGEQPRLVRRYPYPYYGPAPVYYRPYPYYPRPYYPYPY